MGQVGNENLPNDAASEYFAFDGRNYYLGDTEKRGVNLGKFGNPDLKWETTTEVNFGLDFGFFRNRINGSVDVFFKEVKDLLMAFAAAYSCHYRYMVQHWKNKKYRF